MEAEAVALAPPGGRGEVNRRCKTADQAPELRGRAMTQDGPGPGSEHGSHPARQVRLERPEPIDTSVKEVEPLDSQPVLDVRVRQAKSEQLRPGNYAVLPACKLENRPVLTARVAFPVTIAVNATRMLWAVGITLPHCRL
jgi:hypothetical protein